MNKSTDGDFRAVGEPTAGPAGTSPDSTIDEFKHALEQLRRLMIAQLNMRITEPTRKEDRN